MNDLTNTDAVNQELARPVDTQEVPRKLELHEAETHRREIKRRIRVEHMAAAKDIEEITAQIAEIDRVVAQHQANRDGLEQMLKLAKERLMTAKFSMARYV